MQHQDRLAPLTLPIGQRSAADCSKAVLPTNADAAMAGGGHTIRDKHNAFTGRDHPYVQVRELVHWGREHADLTRKGSGKSRSCWNEPTPPHAPPAAPWPRLPMPYAVSMKLDPTLASAQIEMTPEVQVNAADWIDEQTARIVLENSQALKVEKPGLY
jgi:hypothetical protein